MVFQAKLISLIDVHLYLQLNYQDADSSDHLVIFTGLQFYLGDGVCLFVLILYDLVNTF